MENRICSRVDEWVVDPDVDELKKEMASHGYDYDDIDSDPDGGYIVFNSEYGTFPSGGFGSWDDVRKWLQGMVFDEPMDDVNESRAGYVVSDADGNVLTFSHGHRYFAPMGDDAVVYPSPSAADSVLYIFSSHRGMKGLSVRRIDDGGAMYECVDESDEGDDAAVPQSDVSRALKRNGAKFTEKAGGKAVVKGSLKHGMKVGQKYLAKKAGVKVAAKAAAKATAKAVGKSLLKKVPGVSLVIGGKYAWDRAKDGEYLKALGELGSGIAGCIPGYGTAVSLGLDAAMAGSDIANAVSKGDEDEDVSENAVSKGDEDEDVSENFEGAEHEEYPRPCDGLAKRKTVRAAQNYVYNAVLPVINGLFKDDYWEPVHRVFDMLSGELGMNVNYGARNDSYYQHGYSLDGKAKAWQFDAKYRNDFGKEITLNGQVIAHAAGTVEDPMSRYDLTFQLF